MPTVGVWRGRVAYFVEESDKPKEAAVLVAA